MPLSGPDMSPRAMHLVSASNDAAGSDESDPLAVGISGQLLWIEGEESETVAFLSAEPGCWPHVDAAPTEEVPAAARAGKGAVTALDNGLGAGRLVARTIESPELDSSLALRLPAGFFGGC